MQHKYCHSTSQKSLIAVNHHKIIKKAGIIALKTLQLCKQCDYPEAMAVRKVWNKVKATDVIRILWECFTDALGSTRSK
jgi:hypothetical protein